MKVSKLVFRMGQAVVWFLLVMAVLWAAGALWFDIPVRPMGKVMAGLWGLAVLAASLLVKPRWRAKVGILVGVLVIAGWWLTLSPRQDRAWKPEVARLARVVEANGEVVIENVRNFDYRSETDFTPRYETRKYQLSHLRGADLFVNYWGSALMAHPIVSFDFGPDGRVCFSIETRPEKGEAYSALGGIYRQFELIYVVADERDVIGVRAKHRVGEDVYLYHLRAPRAMEWFKEYVQTVNDLSQKPRWYHAVTNNCTTAMRQQRAESERAPWDWRMLVNGYGDEMLYERKVLDGSLPFAELKKRSHINERVKAAVDATDFSEKIREGLPGMP